MALKRLLETGIEKNSRKVVNVCVNNVTTATTLPSPSNKTKWCEGTLGRDQSRSFLQLTAINFMVESYLTLMKLGPCH